MLGVRVAVLDTGFDLDHPDLAPNINFALSKNFVDGETLSYALPIRSATAHMSPAPSLLRITVSVSSVLPRQAGAAKVLSDAGSGSFADVIEAIVYAADVDADVINMSLGATVPKYGFWDS